MIATITEGFIALSNDISGTVQLVPAPIKLGVASLLWAYGTIFHQLASWIAVNMTLTDFGKYVDLRSRMAIAVLAFVCGVFLSSIVLAIVWNIIQICFYGLLMCCRAIWSIFKTLISLLMVLDRIASALKSTASRMTTKRPSEYTSLPKPSHPTLPSQMTPEAAMPNSDYHDVVTPLFQGTVVAGCGKPVCQALRIGDWIVFPAHGYDPSLDMSIHTPKQRDQAVMKIVDEHIVEVCHDVLAVRCPVSFPLRKATVKPLCASMATCTAGRPNSGSIGKIVAGEHELLEYHGSTAKGHSGAAYTQGSALVGIHMGSSANVNIGYAATYIEYLLGRIDFVPESSDFVYLSSLSDKQLRSLGFRSTGDPEEMEVKVGGRFYRISVEEHQRLMNIAEDEAERDFEDMMETMDRGASDTGYNATRGFDYGSRRDDKLHRELASLRRRVKQYEALLPSVEEPLPEFSHSENCWRPRTPQVGSASGKAPVTTPPKIARSSGTPTASRKVPTSSAGQKSVGAPCDGVSSSIPKSANAPEPRLKNRRRVRSRPSKPSTSRDTSSDTVARVSTSTLKKGDSGSRSASADLTSLRRQVLELSKALQRLDKH